MLFMRRLLLSLIVFLLFIPAALGATWQTTASMTPRAAHHAILLPNGKVLVAGNSFTCQLFDPVTGGWSSTGSMITTRYGFDTATLLPNGQVLVAGGHVNSMPSGYTSSCEVYDPVAGTWAQTGDMITARGSFTATLMSNGKVLAVAGQVNYNGNIFQASTYTNACEIYDPATGVWTAAAALDEHMRAQAATQLPTGQILISGGNNDVGYYLTTCRLYDPASDSWLVHGDMITARSDHPALLLPNGNVLVVGGLRGGALSACELYDPSTGVWTATGSLNNQRFYHSTNLLPNGKVLTAGGYDYSTPGYALNSCELYDPATGALGSYRQPER